MLKTFMGRDIIIKKQELSARLIVKSTGAAAFFYGYSCNEKGSFHIFLKNFVIVITFLLRIL